MGRESDLTNKYKKRPKKRPQAREGIQVIDLRYDTYQGKWWDIKTGYAYSESRQVNALVHKDQWLLMPEPQEGGNIILKRKKPADYTSLAENDLTIDNTTWDPAFPRMIENHLIINDAIKPIPHKRMLNLYQPPEKPKPLNGRSAEVWIEHCKSLWPQDHEYFLDYCAHMIQRPPEKTNTIVVLSGGQGVGKDSALQPVRRAVGYHNVQEITPDALVSQFNPWRQCVMLVINEVIATKDDMRATAIYGALKLIAVTPPDVITLEEKYMKKRQITNVFRIFITTNEMHSIYMSPDDRRMYIMHTSQIRREPEYFRRLFHWYDKEDGYEIVAAYLNERDISAFEPKTPAPMTAGKAVILGGWAPPDDALAKALDILQRPPLFFPEELLEVSFDGKPEIQSMMNNARTINNRMRREGYHPNPFASPADFVGKTKRRFKRCFYREDLIGNIEKINELIAQRGQMLADEIPQTAQYAQSRGGF